MGRVGMRKLGKMKFWRIVAGVIVGLALVFLLYAIAERDRTIEGMVNATRFAMDNPDITAENAAGQIWSLGRTKNELQSSVESSANFIAEMDLHDACLPN